MQVFVAVYEHRHGSDIRVFDDAAKAQAWKDEIARDYWEEIGEELDGDDYFADVEGEYFSVHYLEVE